MAVLSWLRDNEKEWESIFEGGGLSRPKKHCAGCGEFVYPRSEFAVDRKTNEHWHKWCCIAEIDKRKKERDNHGNV